MSDQSLRDALEKLVEHWRYKGEDLKAWQEGGGPDPYEAGLDDAATAIRKLLTESPAEPVGVSDEAVDAALDVAMDDGHNGIDCRPERDFSVTMRAALEAAAPLMGATPPQPTREALMETLSEHKQGLQPSGARCSCGWTERPYGSLLWTPDEWREHLADAVLALMGGAAE